jgi:hypothetical protein
MISDHWERESILSRLIPILPLEKLTDAFRIARDFPNPAIELKNLAAIAVRALEDRHPSEPNLILVADIVIALCGFEPTLMRNSALKDILPYLAEARNADATALFIEAAVSNEQALIRARTLAFIASALPQVDRKRVIARAVDIVRRASFSTEDLAEAHAIWLLYDDKKEPHRAKALADIMSVLPPEERPALVHEARRAARSLPRSVADKRAEFLALLAAFAPEDARESLVAEALAAVKAVEDVFDKENVLNQIAASLSPDLGREAVNAALTIDSVAYRVPALEAIAPRISDQDLLPALQKTLADARKIGDNYAREETLVTLDHFRSGGTSNQPAGARDKRSNATLRRWRRRSPHATF